VKNKLVTGGCGFIGSNVVRSAFKTARQMNLVNFDKLICAGNPSSLVDLESDSKHCFVAGNISETMLVSSEAAEFLFKPTDHNALELKHEIIRINKDLRIDWALAGVPALSAKDKHVKPFRNAGSLA
jgi:nucleoside-diphosphate-sugar epimerase